MKGNKNNKQGSYRGYQEINEMANKLWLKFFLQVLTRVIARNLAPSFRE
jgi:hypothetical protein